MGDIWFQEDRTTCRTANVIINLWSSGIFYVRNTEGYVLDDALKHAIEVAIHAIEAQQ